MPRYGTINSDYIASWFEREDPGGPMWALNLMKYRDQADYVDGRDSETDEQHKDAGMDFTIVMATFPVEGDPVPPQESGTEADKLMLLADPTMDEVARSLTDSTTVLF